MSRLEFLHAELQEHIDRFDCESRQHKILYRRLRYSVFSLTACSTVLAGLALSYPKLQGTLNMVILLVTAAIGVLTSIEGLRKPGELWIHERTTHYALKDLKRDLEYRTAELEQRVVLDDFFLRLQAILGAAGEKWDRNIVRGTAQNVQPGAAGATPERARS